MSLWFPVMVNNTQIGTVTITRQEELKSVRQVHEYTWEAVFNPLDTYGKPSKQKVRVGGTVCHRYDLGWGALAAKVLTQFDTGYRP